MPRRDAKEGSGEKNRSLRAQLGLLAGNTGFMLVCLVGFTNALARTGALFSIVPVTARDRLGLAASEIGFGLALGSVIGLAVTYPAGALVDRYGRKIMIVPMTMLTAVAMLCFCLAPSYAWFLLACAIWGGASAASSAAPAAYAADSAPRGMNAAAMSSYRTLSDVGYVAGPLLLGLLGDWGGLDLPFWVAAAGLFLVALLFARLAPESHRRA